MKLINAKLLLTLVCFKANGLLKRMTTSSSEQLM